MGRKVLGREGGREREEVRQIAGLRQVFDEGELQKGPDPMPRRPEYPVPERNRICLRSVGREKYMEAA
jgi:hypothetical protein